MYDKGETNGEKRSKSKKRTATDHTETLTNQPKTPQRNANAVSTPIRQYFPYLRSMPVRLMYDKGETNGEKTSKDKKVTAPEHKETITHEEENAFRLEFPQLCRSKYTAAIRIKCDID
jgi:hypothetical protein